MIANYLIITIIGIPILFIVTVIYIKILKFIAKQIKGATKTVFTLVFYTAYCVPLVMPLFFLMKNAKPEEAEITWPNLIITLILYLLIVLPSMYYFFLKKEDLKEIGYIQ